MMTRIKEGTEVFVHASDIQLLDDEPIRQILDWEPSVVLVSGPPIYRDLPAESLVQAANRAKTLAKVVRFCIVDHHVLRCMEGVRWLEKLMIETEGKILCAADFMKRPRRFLEARRMEFYRRSPVPDDWHERYSNGLVDTNEFRR
jgi:hypothetical protein